MRYGLVAPELHGHLNPLTTLGQSLKNRGHDVIVLGSERAKRFADRSELDWFPMCDSPDIGAGWDFLGELSGLKALKFCGQLIKRTMELTVEQAASVYKEKQLDALVVDQLSPAAAFVAERHALPFAVACNAIAIHLSPEIPPPALAWTYRSDLYGRLRNRLGNWLAIALFCRLSGAEATTGVDPMYLADLTHTRGAAIVSQQPSCFDFPSHPRPENFFYTAPWYRNGRDQNIEFPWDRIDSNKTLIYASLGTLQNKLMHVYHAILESVSGMDVQLVLSLGNPQGRIEFPIPPNTLVVPFAPQVELLEKAKLVITHAGLNTALETLSKGLPMLCLPITNDQPGVASRVKHLGLGETLPIRKATSKRIRDNLEVLLSTDKYRTAARKLQSEFNSVDGAAKAAEIIDRAISC
ncbi:MAG: hypothetical protein KDB03_14190 [Planctomycetales bacterium]|nr:hypothetical protein [Planctomycetales bacterium]